MEPSAPIKPVKKSGFAAFQMDDSDEDDHAVDSDEAPIITKAPEPKQKAKKGKKKEEEEENVAATSEGKNNAFFKRGWVIF